MTRSEPLMLIALLLAASIAAFGCTKTIHYKETPAPTVKAKAPGPPPHAPAHGYRHKHPDGVAMVYESNIGVYVVTGYAEVYFHKDRYYRLRDDCWQISAHIDGPWKVVSAKKLPPGLQKKVASPGKGKGKNKK